MSEKRIAIVDDDEALRVALGDLMRSMGHSVVFFESADDFLRHADRDTLSGAIVDVQMPGASGFDLAYAVRADPHPMPLILLTARPDASFDAEAAAAEVVVILRKPFDPMILFEHIERSFR